jgi:hypothetical protein
MTTESVCMTTSALTVSQMSVPSQNLLCIQIIHHDAINSSRQLFHDVARMGAASAIANTRHQFEVELARDQRRYFELNANRKHSCQSNFLWVSQGSAVLSSCTRHVVRHNEQAQSLL